MKIILYLEKNYTLFGNLSVATLSLMHVDVSSSNKNKLTVYQYQNQGTEAQSVTGLSCAIIC